MSQYLIKTTSKRQFAAACAKLRQMGKGGAGADAYSASVSHILVTGINSSSISDSYKRTNYPSLTVVSFDAFAAINGITLPQSATLRLGRNYTADINYSTQNIQIGCQAVSFTKAKALVALVKKTA